MSEVKQNKIRHTVECHIDPNILGKFLLEQNKETKDIIGKYKSIDFNEVYSLTIDANLKIETSKDNYGDVTIIKQTKIKSILNLKIVRKFLEGKLGFPIEGKLEAINVGCIWGSDRENTPISVKIIAIKEDRLKEIENNS